MDDLDPKVVLRCLGHILLISYKGGMCSCSSSPRESTPVKMYARAVEVPKKKAGKKAPATGAAGAF